MSVVVMVVVSVVIRCGPEGGEWIGGEYGEAVRAGCSERIGGECGCEVWAGWGEQICGECGGEFRAGEGEWIDDECGSMVRAAGGERIGGECVGWRCGPERASGLVVSAVVGKHKNGQRRQ